MPKSFAYKIVYMKGYDDEQSVIEIMSCDECTKSEAIGRLAKAKESKAKRRKKAIRKNISKEMSQKYPGFVMKWDE